MRGFLAQLQFGNVVLVDIAEDPDAAKIGDGEGGRRSGEADACSRRIGHVLSDDDAGDGRIYIDDAAGMILVDAEDLQLLFGRIKVGLGILLCSRRPAPPWPGKWRRA